MLIIVEIICALLSSCIISLWRGKFSDRGAKGTIDYRRLDKGSYLGFLVAMAVCLLIAKALILFFKLINLQEKIPYFDVFNLFLSAAMVALLGLASILGSVAASKHSGTWSKHTIPAGVVFGWFALVALAVETVLCYLELRK